MKCDRCGCEKLGYVLSVPPCAEHLVCEDCGQLDWVLVWWEFCVIDSRLPAAV